MAGIRTFCAASCMCARAAARHHVQQPVVPRTALLPTRALSHTQWLLIAYPSLPLCLCLCLCVQELRLSGEYAEALRRLTEMRVVPLSLRSFVVGAALQGALDSTAFAERSRVGKLLAALVPAKVLTRAMLNEGVTAWMAGWADHKEDCPKIADMLSMVFGTGLLVGTLKEGMAAGGAGGAAAALPPHDAEAIRAGGYVKVECIHPELAAALKLPAPQLRLAGTALPKRADEEEEAAPAPAPAAAAARPVTPPVDDEDDGGVVVKKKKKKAVRAAEEEED